MKRILFLTNIERQIWFWQQAVALLDLNKVATEFSQRQISESTPWGKEWLALIEKQDLVLIKWMGTGLDCSFLRNLSAFMQQAKIKHLFLIADAGQDNLSLGLNKEQENKIYKYFNYGGINNFENCLLWLTSEILGEKQFYYEPKLLPWNGIYHYASENIYEDLASYQAKYCRPNRATIGLIFYRDEWILGDLSYQTEIIKALEARNLNVIAVFSNGQANPDIDSEGLREAFAKYFYQDTKPIIDVLINCIKFSLTTTRALDLAVLENLNVPILQAYTLANNKVDWEKSCEGMTPMEISISISLPEFDGVIHSIPVATNERTDEGRSRYICLPERIELLARKVEKWTNLKYKKNSAKKVAIVFHNYPALNSNIGSAAGLDSPESVRLLLKELARQGYEVDWIPENSQEFMKILTANATNDRRYISERQIADAYGHLSTAAYLDFFKKLDEKTKAQLTLDWQEAPGDVFNYDGQLLIPGTINGNIFITVQPPRGFEEDSGKLIHSPDCAPTHHYIGFYHWLRDIWQADAVIHVGTHGTLEWLPGKGAGLSKACYPDISIGDMPNIYHYWITVVGEGVQAKRRSAACLISYLSPPMTTSGIYEELEELEKTLDEYCHFKTTQPENIATLQDLVREKANAANLTEEILEDDCSNFEDYVGKLHSYVTDIKNMQMRCGLHILGEAPQSEELTEYIFSLTRLENGDIAALTKTLANIYGFDYYTLLENSSVMCASRSKTYGAVIDEIFSLARRFVEYWAKQEFVLKSCEEIFAWPEFKNCNNLAKAELEKIAGYICETIYPNLVKTKQEIDNTLRALQAEYIQPSPAGAPSSGGADLLPTGRNFYGVDPRTLPTPAAWEIGKNLSEQVIERYIAEEGTYPESVGIILWAGANMRSHGQCIAEFLHLMGVRPIWQKGSLRVIDLEVISLDQLQRPRVDVTGRVSGLFRDSMPGAINWLDKAVKLVADLDEPLEMNFIRKHMLLDTQELINEGVAEDLAWQQAGYRIFGDPPGAYGAGVGQLLESKNWTTIDDLANVYVRFSAHAYGNDVRGSYQPQLFKKRMSQLDVTIKNGDNRESHMLNSDDYNAYHGGMIATVRSLSGKKPRSYCGDSTDRSKVEMRSLQEEMKRIFRGEAVNPKFIQGMKKHGYKGAQDMANYLAHSYQWDATSGIMEDWMYEKYATKYAFDKEIQDWMRAVNPWALQRLTEILLEAEQRGLWNAQPETKAELQKIYLSLEGELEERNDG